MALGTALTPAYVSSYGVPTLQFSSNTTNRQVPKTALLVFHANAAMRQTPNSKHILTDQLRRPELISTGLGLGLGLLRCEAWPLALGYYLSETGG